MNTYLLSTNDQLWNNWLVKVQPHNAHVFPRKRFENLVCPKCLQADYDAIYKKGPDKETRIRARGDFILTCDHYHCVNEKLYELLITNKVRGVRFKQIGTSSWYLMNITCRVASDPKVYNVGTDLFGKSHCSACKRILSLAVSGIHEFESQIQKPMSKLTIFTTKPPFLTYPWVFMTKDVVDLLVDGGIKGGQVRRLLTADEEKAYKASVKSGKERWPPHSRINL